MDFSELTDFPEYLKIFVGLFAMVDPVGIAPVYLGATTGLDTDVRLRVGKTAVATMVGVLAIFVFFGDAILDLFGIDLAAFQVAGGLLLLAAAFQLMAGKTPAADVPEGQRHLVGVVPLGIPMLAGPATISAVMVFSAEHEGVSHDIVLMGAIVLMAGLVYAVLRFAPVMERRISGNALAAFTRVMGLIVASVGVEFLFAGILYHFPGLAG